MISTKRAGLDLASYKDSPSFAKISKECAPVPLLVGGHQFNRRAALLSASILGTLFALPANVSTSSALRTLRLVHWPPCMCSCTPPDVDDTILMNPTSEQSL